MLSLLKKILFWSFGNNSFSLSIGPAINCGKKSINSVMEKNPIICLSKILFFTSIIDAIANVIKEIANGISPL